MNNKSKNWYFLTVFLEKHRVNACLNIKDLIICTNPSEMECGVGWGKGGGQTNNQLMELKPSDTKKVKMKI